MPILNLILFVIVSAVVTLLLFSSYYLIFVQKDEQQQGQRGTISLREALLEIVDDITNFINTNISEQQLSELIIGKSFFGRGYNFQEWFLEVIKDKDEDYLNALSVKLWESPTKDTNALEKWAKEKIENRIEELKR